MCGITGIVKFHDLVSTQECNLVESSARLLSRRGPDNQSIQSVKKICFGHARLSIIDTSARSNQPMTDFSGRHLITYNGELYNYKEIRHSLESKGIQFKTNSDTEVLLNAYILYGKDCVQMFNGFFAFGIYDTKEDVFFGARDRLGIKPFYYQISKNEMKFASELKALKPYSNNWQLNHEALRLYFELTYVPAPLSMVEGINKLLPGEYIECQGGKVSISRYFHLKNESGNTDSFNTAASKVKELLIQSVDYRLIADVPIGTFLSGGIDSSIISWIAAQKKTNLETFSIGFKDLPWFDESKYAKIVAQHIGSTHHEIMVSEKDLCNDVTEMLDLIDEPFADSSAVAVFALSKETSKHVKVALSGDGADELFGGYNKHRALLRSNKSSFTNSLIRSSKPVFSAFLGSRDGKISNTIRKANKFAEILDLPLAERYWKLASWTDEETVNNLLKFSSKEATFKSKILKTLENASLNDLLISDINLVLANDMLTKVDRMSMNHGLEVRTPFLDHTLVNYVCSLPFNFKANKKKGKLLLRQAFKADLPDTIFTRAKKGFEIPIEQWLKGELSELLKNSVEEKFIEEQGLFNVSEIKNLLTKLKSKNVGDSPATLWSIIVFQAWWKQHFNF